ncbi:hypothetical protein [Pseudovibrio sp. Ad5]|uniref:hypothetical protein n=1 Tax=Pseudovibrio sp. Ad5 TaxID=989436 RepID=UPI00128FD0C7|nr:hypothetical protein [Pseudovibrio sp. Ad5]
MTNTKITLGDREVTTLTVTVHNRNTIEAAADPSTIDPYAKFAIRLAPEQDTAYSESAITSDGKYVYVTVSGARIVGKTIVYVYTLEGAFVRSIVSSGIRAESLDTLQRGYGGYLPILHEAEGFTFHQDKLITASRYTFATGGDVVSWRGENFVYINPSDDKGNYPSHLSYWAPTDAPASAEFDPTTVYSRGTALAHHYVHAYVTAGNDDDEEFAIDVNSYDKPNVLRSVGGGLSSRNDFSVLFDPTNTKELPAMATFRTNGQFLFYDAEKLNTEEHASDSGGKIAVNDTDIRFQHVSGLVNSAALVLTTSDNSSFQNNVLFYAGDSSLGGRVDPAGYISYGYVRPANDNVHSCGRPSHRWDTVFSATAAINTSDETKKQFLEVIKPEQAAIREDERAAALEIARDIRKFQFLDAIEQKTEDGARWHFGAGAQSVAAIMQKYGLAPNRYSFFCYDKWEASPEVWDVWEEEYEIIPAKYDNEGKLVRSETKGALIREAGKVLLEPAREAGELYGIRYIELHSFIIDALTTFIDAKFVEIEMRLSALE